YRDLLAVYQEVLVLGRYSAFEWTVGRVPLKQVGISCGVGKVIDRYNLDVVRMSLKDGAEGEAADAAKSVDADADGHVKAPFKVRRKRRWGSPSALRQSANQAASGPLSGRAVWPGSNWNHV